MIWFSTAALVGGVILLVMIGLVLWMLVDDWSRDLTTNHAATAENAKNPALRPIEASESPEELAGRVTAAAEKLKGWRLAKRSESEPANHRALDLHFIRTTPLLRFKDDIHVRIEATASGSKLSAESRSRIGKGDLGQNPRNLAELLSAVRKSQGTVEK